ncbi:MAG: 16S rRNA (cytosine(1402)-N(4))-methyltransferase RsmH [Bacteroidales bacterium]
MEEVYHDSVMLTESIEGLNISPNGIYVDVTFGGGGHSKAILERLKENGRLLAFDQDQDALQEGSQKKIFQEAGNRFTLIDQNFKYLKNYLRINGVTSIDGLLADLGVSSHQFDVAERGFSTRSRGPLDMRMDRRQSLTAADVLNTYEEEALSEVFFKYGEIFEARRVARDVVSFRKVKEFEYTDEGVAFFLRFAKKGKENKFLAMAFQALRIEVNQEMKMLEDMLRQSLEMLKPGGRLVVMSYHSLEDRLVKNFMRSGNMSGEIEKDFYGNNLSPFVLVNRKVILPTSDELQKNPRSRSAKLRIAEKK